MPAKPDIDFESELWETAVTLRGTVAPADYKHYVLPLLFLRYLSLRYEQRRARPASRVLSNRFCGAAVSKASSSSFCSTA